ncbi:MAG: ankyrin repeat domain-containing protein [Fibrobacter sp.]|nr:ankyrin repeat domain-containing protein [Fibrobacter sp.]
MKNKILMLCTAASLLFSMTACDDTVDMNDPSSVRKALTKKGVPFSPNQFVKFAAAGDTANLTLMVKATMDINVADDNGNNAVAIVANKGDLSTLKYLFANGATANVRNSRGETILENAVAMGNKDVVNCVIDQLKKENADPQAMNPAVHFAAKAGKAEMLEVLAAAGAPLGMMGPDGYMPIHWTAKEGNYDALMVLINHGVAVNDTCAEGYSALDWADNAGWTRLKAALKNAGAKVTAKYKKDSKRK